MNNRCYLNFVVLSSSNFSRDSVGSSSKSRTGKPVSSSVCEDSKMVAGRRSALLFGKINATGFAHAKPANEDNDVSIIVFTLASTANR